MTLFVVPWENGYTAMNSGLKTPKTLRVVYSIVKQDIIQFQNDKVKAVEGYAGFNNVRNGILITKADLIVLDIVQIKRL